MEEKTTLGARLDVVEGEALPNFNELVLHFLRQSGMSVEQFRQCYGQAVKGRPYTKARVYQMIQDKSFPTDPKRRWAIAKLLQIPPLLLGVNALDDLLPELRTEHTLPEPERTASLDTASKSLDLREYRRTLEEYWDLNLDRRNETILQEIDQRIFSLEQALLYGSHEKKQRPQFVRLLCEYLMVFGDIACDQEWYETAITHFNKAYALAKNEQLPAIQAAVLKGRGDVFLDWAEMSGNMFGANHSHRYLSLAVDDLKVAREIAQRDPTFGGKGYLQLSFGDALARIATNPQEHYQALREIDKAEAFIGKGFSGVATMFVKLDEERYHLDRASTYLSASVRVAQYPREARRELWNAIATQVNSKTSRRQAFNTVLFAKSYLVGGEYDEATKKAGEALAQARTIHSHVNLARVATICQGLHASGYSKNHPEVSSLEIEITRARHPGLFGEK